MDTHTHTHSWGKKRQAAAGGGRSDTETRHRAHAHTHVHTRRRDDTIFTPTHRHRSTWLCLRCTHTPTRTDTGVPTCAHVPRLVQQDTDTPVHTHRRTLLLVFLGDAHSQRGPGELAQQDDSCVPVPVSWAAAGQPASSRSDRHAHHCSEDAPAASPPLSPRHNGAQPCPSGVRRTPPALVFSCGLGSMALQPETLCSPLSLESCPALCIWEPVTHGCREGARFVSAVVSHNCPDLLGSQPAHLCM